MEVTYDEAKNKANVAKHGISFVRVADLDWAADYTIPDNRFSYNEQRFFTLAPLDNLLHAVSYAITDEGIRVISFRKATPQERRIYDKQSTS